MKCEHCEVACATLECLECKVKDQEEPVQLCEDCSQVIHKGRMTTHTVTERAISLKKHELRKKLDVVYGLRPGLENRVTDISAARSELQNRIRCYERDLRATVTELQTKIKDRCRNLYTSIKDDINATCLKLNDHEQLIHEHMMGIKRVGEEIETAIREQDESEFLDNLQGLEEKVSTLHLTKLPLDLPDLDIDFKIEVGDIESTIQAISLKRVETEASFDIPPIPAEPGYTMKVYVSGRMTKDSTFCIQPAQLGDDVFATLDRMNTAIRSEYIKNLDWPTFAASGTTPAIGEHVFVLFSNDKKWYRGRVEELKPGKICSVLYTDFGNIESVNYASMLPKRSGIFPDVPQQTLECTLFEALRSDLSNSARWAFSDLVNDTPCTCTVMAKIEDDGRDVWQVDLKVEHEDGSIVDVANVVQEKIDESGSSSAIKCRDVRLLDNPEVYSKLTTVTIERPSKPKPAEDTTSNPVPDQVDESCPESQPSTDSNHVQPGPCSTDQHPNDLSTDDAHGGESLGPQEHQVDAENSSPSDDGQEGRPVEPHAAAYLDGDAILHASEQVCETQNSKNDTPSPAREDFEAGMRGVADSPSCDDYQSAASSLDDQSGSITPVSASSHLSNPASHTADPLPTEDLVDTTPPANPTDSPTKTAELDPDRTRQNKKKKKKRRRESERNEEEKMPAPGEVSEKTPIEADQPAAEDVLKPFVVTEWLNQSGRETPDHQKLRATVHQVAKVLPGGSDQNIGDLVLALDDRDMWQRAVLTAIKGRRVEVQFIDVPKERSMQAENNIKSLLPKLRRLSPAVVLPEAVQNLLVETYGGNPEDLHPVTVSTQSVAQKEVENASETVEPYQPVDDQMEDPSNGSYPVMDGQYNDMNNHVDYNSYQGASQTFQPQENSYGPGRGPLDARRRRQGDRDRWDNPRERLDPRDRGDRRPVTCFNCGELGHIVAECPASQRSRDSNVVCYNCKSEGHVRADCPMPKSAMNYQRQQSNRREGGGGGGRRNERRTGGKPRRHGGDDRSWRNDRSDNSRSQGNRHQGNNYSSEGRASDNW